MQVLVVANQKGGSGKTTVSSTLAVEAARSGVAVVLMDLDPQGSLSEWFNRREDESVRFAIADVPNLAAQLELLAHEGTDLVIIDTPPSLGEALLDILRVADLILIPLKPSGFDLLAVGPTLDLVDESRARHAFVMTDANPRAKSTASAREELAKHAPVAPGALSTRDGYRSAVGHGKTLPEFDPKNPGVGEVAALWSYVSTQLRKSARLATNNH